MRAATRAAASQDIDLSYITAEYLALQGSADYPDDVVKPLEGAAANDAIASYDGPPLESTTTDTGVTHAFLMFGHQAARLNEYQWLRRVAELKDGAWICRPEVVRGGGDAQLVGAAADGSPIWEFRL